MPRERRPLLACGAAMTVATGLVAGPDWPAWVMGVVLAVALAVGVGLQHGGGRVRFDLQPVPYAVGAVMATAGGAVLAAVATSAAWPVATVVAIALSPASTRTPEQRPRA